MKIYNLLFVGFGCMSLCSAAFADLPIRKAGLWEVSVQVGQGRGATSMKQCIDAKTDQKMQDTGSDMAGKMGGKCNKNEFHKTSSGYSGETTCEIGGSTMVTTSTFVGDFNSAYTGEINTSYNPPFLGSSSNKVMMTAKWIGPCESGMVPGDMLLANGKKMNIDTMAAQAGQAAQMLKDPKFAQALKGAGSDLRKTQADAFEQALQQLQNNAPRK